MRHEDPGTGQRGEGARGAEGCELASRQGRMRFLAFCVLLALVLLAGNVLYGTVLTTRRSRAYCLSCHQKVGPALMWEPSERHSEGMACVACHGLLPGQPGRCGALSARADTINPNCMGCHPSVLDGRPLGKVVEVSVVQPEDPTRATKTYRWELRNMMYGWHLKDKVCLCTDCHRNIAHERESGVFEHRPKMAYCKACHYHAVKDDYVRVTPLPRLEVREAAGVAGPGPRGP